MRSAASAVATRLSRALRFRQLGCMTCKCDAQVGENTELLMTFRDNILSILNHMQNMGGVMSDMPALPVRMNVELANNFLPRGPPGLGGMPPFTLSMQARRGSAPPLRGYPSAA